MRLLVSMFLMASLPCLAAMETPPAYRIEINLPAFRLFLFYGEELTHDYPIAIGKPSMPTPVGHYSVVSKIHNPTWLPLDGGKPVPPGPANPLGRWWLGLSRQGYGIHGNNNENSIGTPISHGCIRMHNRDVEQLVRYVGTGMTVDILYRMFALRGEIQEGDLQLWIGRDVYKRYRSLAEDAVEFMKQAADTGCCMSVLLSMLGKNPASDWYDIPLAISLYRRETMIGEVFRIGGRIWLTSDLAETATEGAFPASGAYAVDLEELANKTASTMDWRYRATDGTLICYPARLRWGDQVCEDSVRLEQGRVLIDREAVAILLGIVPAAPGVGDDRIASEDGQEVWLGISESAPPGWRLSWSPETWEVVAEREDAPGTDVNDTS